ALRGVRGRAAGDRAFHRAVLLPLHVSARGRPRHPRPHPHVRLAQALQRLRQSLPALRQHLPGAGDPPGWPDQRQRVHLLPRLPAHVLRRTKMPACDPGQYQARAAAHDGIGLDAFTEGEGREGTVGREIQEEAGTAGRSGVRCIQDRSSARRRASMTDNNDRFALSRRGLLGGTAKAAAFAGLGAAAGLGVGALRSGTATNALVGEAKAAEAGAKGAVAPGDLDDYYGFWSSGQSGEIRIFGVPSMRELIRIPVFNYCGATGWGVTNESRKILTEGLQPETRKFLESRGGIFLNGDAHHPHMSFTDGTYDGRYIFINDKANSRIARIRCDIMRTDRIIEIPNACDMHGMRPQKYPRTGYIFVNQEHRIPMPNDGKILDDATQYRCVFTAVDGDEMKVAWQVLVDGNLDNTDCDYQGKYAFSTCYNSEEATDLAGMSEREQDWVVIFNIARIEEAVRNGDY